MNDTLTNPHCENFAKYALMTDVHAKCENGGIIYPRGRHGCHAHAWIDNHDNHRE